jgi:hypothetical protein
MSGEPMASRRSAQVLRQRAGNLNVLAFALLVAPLLGGALSSAWWVEWMSQPTKGQLVLMVWIGAVVAAAASGGLAAAVGGVVLNAMADSQDADRYPTDSSE